MTQTTGATPARFTTSLHRLAALFAIVAAPIACASAQEIMLERVGAVRMAAPGELERNDVWLQKAFRNQARIETQQPIRVSSGVRPDSAPPR